jgi:hypothetical protein
MANPYITNVDPYFGQSDLSGYAPIMQDDSKQRAMQAAALAQQLQQVQEAGQQHGSGLSGLNPLAMAMMLRKKKPGTGEMLDAQGNIIKDPTYGAGDAYGNMTSGEIANMQQYGV